MKYLVLLAICLGLSSCGDDTSSNIPRLKEMFAEMVIKKDASKIPDYYHEELMLYTNGQSMDYPTFLEMHEKVYGTEIQYTIKYDEETLIEEGDKLAGRVFITTKRPDEEAREIEVILVAQYKEGKLYRIWEVTSPDWSKMPAFKNSEM